MWFVELNGADGQPTDGNRVGRITMEGAVTEFPMPSQAGSPINIAVGPDRNVWYTKGDAVGRVTSDGVITEFTAGEGARPVGLSAGADRQPPERLVNRLYFADAANDRISYFSFS
jgi:virginiamycin B lyase